MRSIPHFRRLGGEVALQQFDGGVGVGIGAAGRGTRDGDVTGAPRFGTHGVGVQVHWRRVRSCRRRARLRWRTFLAVGVSIGSSWVPLLAFGSITVVGCTFQN